jgi:hypothetical protein
MKARLTVYQITALNAYDRVNKGLGLFALRRREIQLPPHVDDQPKMEYLLWPVVEYLLAPGVVAEVYPWRSGYVTERRAKPKAARVIVERVTLLEPQYLRRVLESSGEVKKHLDEKWTLERILRDRNDLAEYDRMEKRARMQ